MESPFSKRVVIFSAEYGVLYDCPEENLLFIHWTGGDIPDEEYRVFWDIALKACVDKHYSRLLIDQREIGYVSMSARAWLLLKWLPRARRAVGTDFRTAILRSKHIMHGTGMNYLVNGIKKVTSFQFEFVNSLEEGVEWLITHKVKS